MGYLVAAETSLWEGCSREGAWRRSEKCLRVSVYVSGLEIAGHSGLSLFPLSVPRVSCLLNLWGRPDSLASIGHTLSLNVAHF